MKLTQNWVGYLDRSYEQIKRSLLSRLGSIAPEISDHTETNPLIILVSMFSGVAEVLNLYIDSMAKEIFMGTARRYTSVIRLAKLMDYNIKAKANATVNILFTLRDVSGDILQNPGGNIIIPKDSVIKSENSSTPFLLEQDAIIRTGLSSVYGVASQYERVLGELLGYTDATNNQVLQLPDGYVHNSLRLLIDGEEWKPYTSLGLMKPTTKGFAIVVTEDNRVYVTLGDNTYGKVPLAGLSVVGNYKVTLGTTGNVPPNSLTTLIADLVLPNGMSVTITNPDYASGGSDFETIEEIRNRAPRSLRSLEKAVTYQDYIDLALMVPGVGSAEVQYCCGKYVTEYIAPNSVGVATPKLLADVRDYLVARKMITTQIDVLPSGLTKIWIKANIYGKSLVPEQDIYNAVINALDAEYGFASILINRKISVSDITNVIENLNTTVDRIEIQQVRILPYTRPGTGTTNQLNIVFTGLPISTTRHTYLIRYKAGPNNFDVYRDNTYLTSIPVDTDYNDTGIVTFKVTPGVYDDNNEWSFVVFPSYPEIFPSTLIAIDDFSAPIIEIDPFISSNIVRNIFSDITIITQGASASSLPPCP